jgi:hypothetical protein
LKTSILFAAALTLSLPAKASPVATIGVGLSTPEIVGLYVSLWPTANLTVDGRLTLATVDAGLTGHFALSSDGAWRHDLLAEVLVGAAVIPTHFGWVGWHGPRVSGLLGYGLLGAIDLRIEAGLAMAAGPNDAWGPGLVALAMVGWPI